MNRNTFFVRMMFTLITICCIAPNSSQGAGVSVANFKVGYIKTSPQTLNSSDSIDVGWTPQIDLVLLVLRSEISLFGVKRSTNSSFLVSNYEALVGLKLLPGFRIEAGGGIQNWHGQGGVSAVGTGGLVFSLGSVLDRIYADYSYVFKTNNETKLLKLGIGFNF